MKQSLLLVSLSVLISLSGCGGGGYSSSTTPPDTPPETPENPVAPAPAVTAIAPNSGPTAGGTSVTLTGTDFTGATAVKFGAADAASFTVDSATTITAVTPPGAAGEVDVTVTTEGGTSAAGAAARFTYIAPPPSAAGLWQGSTDNLRAIGGVVRGQDDGGAYWLVYSSAGSPAPASVTALNAAGFITGAGTETPAAGSATDGAFASANLVEFNFAGAGTAKGSLSAGYTDKAKFGKGLTGAGLGTFTATPAPTTLSHGEADSNLPAPGFELSDLLVLAATDVFIGGAPSGTGTAAGGGDAPSGTTFTFSAGGRTEVVGLTDTTNGQDYTLQGTFSGGVFTPTSAESVVTSCTNNVEFSPPINGCDFAGPGSSTVYATVSGSISASGGTIILTGSMAGLADITTEITFTPVTLANTPANPTFTDGGAPWTITTTGAPALSGTLAFDSYTATITQGAGSTTLTIPERRLTVDGTQGTLTYDAGTNTLTLAGATFTDTSGPLTCSGDAAICGAGTQPTTLPSSANPLTGDVVIAIDSPATGQYQAQVFIGGQSSPDSVLTFDGTLALAPPSTVNFTTDYLAAYENSATLANLQGAHSGSAGVGSAIQPGASFTIAADGALTAGVEASGCTFTGTVAPAQAGNVYDVALTFVSGGSCTYAGEFSGVAFFDENDKLTLTATDEDRDQGFLFIAQ